VSTVGEVMGQDLGIPLSAQGAYCTIGWSKGLGRGGGEEEGGGKRREEKGDKW